MKKKEVSGLLTKKYLYIILIMFVLFLVVSIFLLFNSSKSITGEVISSDVANDYGLPDNLDIVTGYYYPPFGQVGVWGYDSENKLRIFTKNTETNEREEITDNVMVGTQLTAQNKWCNDAGDKCGIPKDMEIISQYYYEKFKMLGFWAVVNDEVRVLVYVDADGKRYWEDITNNVRNSFPSGFVPIFGYSFFIKDEEREMIHLWGNVGDEEKLMIFNSDTGVWSDRSDLISGIGSAYFVPKLGFGSKLNGGEVYLFGKNGVFPELNYYSTITNQWKTYSSATLDDLGLPTDRLPEFGYYDDVNQKAVLVYDNGVYASSTGLYFRKVQSYLEVELIYESQDEFVLGSIEKKETSPFEVLSDGTYNETESYGVIVVEGLEDDEEDDEEPPIQGDCANGCIKSVTIEGNPSSWEKGTTKNVLVEYENIDNLLDEDSLGLGGKIFVCRISDDFCYLLRSPLIGITESFSVTFSDPENNFPSNINAYIKVSSTGGSLEGRSSAFLVEGEEVPDENLPDSYRSTGGNIYGYTDYYYSPYFQNLDRYSRVITGSFGYSPFITDCRYSPNDIALTTSDLLSISKLESNFNYKQKGSIYFTSSGNLVSSEDVCLASGKLRHYFCYGPHKAWIDLECTSISFANPNECSNGACKTTGVTGNAVNEQQSSRGIVRFFRRLFGLEDRTQQNQQQATDKPTNPAQTGSSPTPSPAQKIGDESVYDYTFDFFQLKILSNPPQECWTQYEGEWVVDYSKCDLRPRETIIVPCDWDAESIDIYNRRYVTEGADEESTIKVLSVDLRGRC